MLQRQYNSSQWKKINELTPKAASIIIGLPAKQSSINSMTEIWRISSQVFWCTRVGHRRPGFRRFHLQSEKFQAGNMRYDISWHPELSVRAEPCQQTPAFIWKKYGCTGIEHHSGNWRAIGTSEYWNRIVCWKKCTYQWFYVFCYQDCTIDSCRRPRGLQIKVEKMGLTSRKHSDTLARRKEIGKMYIPRYAMAI